MGENDKDSRKDTWLLYSIYSWTVSGVLFYKNTMLNSENTMLNSEMGKNTMLDSENCATTINGPSNSSPYPKW